MTLTQRNLYFKAGIFISSCCLLLFLALTGRLLPLLDHYCKTAPYRPDDFLQKLAGRFFDPEALIPFITVFASITYTLIVSWAVFYYFEKTQTPEILFFGLFALSFVFEILRIMIPLQGMYEVPPVLLIVGTRMLIFGRLFGTLSLFISSVYAAGLDMQKQGRLIIFMIIGILMVSFRLPVNGTSWDTSFVISFAYSSMFYFMETILVVITVMSFLIAAYLRETGNFRYIALGALLVSAGRKLLINADTWVTPIPALLMLIAGTWLITSRLHQIYLWL